MKKKSSNSNVPDPDRDTLRPEYDFSDGVKGVTAERYRQGTNVVVLDPDVRDVFPDSESVNEALRALAAVVRRHRRYPPVVWPAGGAASLSRSARPASQDFPVRGR